MILSQITPDVAIICESHLKDKQKCGLYNFTNFYRNRSTRNGGGLIVAVNNNIAHRAVMVYSGKFEILVVRLTHTAVPITIVAVYGKVAPTKEEAEQEWEELMMQFTKAKARGDYVMMAGDFNRQVGGVIPGNNTRQDYGGKMTAAELELGNLALVNAGQGIVVGGPMTWIKPGTRVATSALDMWFTCSDFRPKVKDLIIDDHRMFSPFRMVRSNNSSTKRFTDHLATLLTVSNINRPPKPEKTTVWTWGSANWAVYQDKTATAAPKLLGKITKIIDEDCDDSVEKVSAAVDAVMKDLSFTCFKKITIRQGGAKPEPIERPVGIEEENEVRMRRVELFQSQIKTIAEQGATVGQIYSLRSILNGNRKFEQQTPSAVVDPVTGNEVFEVDAIKAAVANHVTETLQDVPALPRYQELATERQNIIGEAAAHKKDEKIEFTEEEMREVIKEMKNKNKHCHKPITMMSWELQRVILTAMNHFAKKEQLPKEYCKTTLTMLKKPKGPNNSLNSYRFIHQKQYLPRTMESLMTKRIKPAVFENISKFQLGGIPSTRPEEHLYSIKTILLLFSSTGLPAWLASFDMCKYFDYQSYSDATVSLVEAGVKGALLRLYLAVTERNDLQVITPVGRTEWITLGALTPQGSSYGAILSALNLDTGTMATFSHLLDNISRVFGLPLLPLLFQDDIIKVSASKFECQLGQSAVTETIHSKQLKLNNDKCKVLIFGRNRRTERERTINETTPIHMDGRAVEISKSEKYLGDWLSERSVADAVKETVAKREVATRGAIAETLLLVQDIKAAVMGPVVAGMTLWQSVILQKVLHNSCTWLAMDKATTRQVEAIQMKFLKKMYALPVSSSNAGVWWLAGVLPMSWRILQAKFKFAYHLELRGPDALAGRIWQLEKRGMLTGGLYSELVKAAVDYNIPLPDRTIPKVEYSKEVAAAIRRAATAAVRAAMLKCTKLRPLHHQTRKGADCNQWLQLEDIRLVMRAKLSCLTQFQADFGTNDVCECGHRLTFLHVALEDIDSCDRWRDSRRKYPLRWDNDRQLLLFTQEVLQCLNQ